MADTQYELFRNLDRRCTADDASPAACVEVAHKKRAIIENELNQTNPLVREVVEGRTTFAALYDGYSRAFRGYRRFLPLPHDPAGNRRLECLARIIPNVGHFKRRSLLAVDNPVTSAVYGVAASFALGFLWTAANRDIAADEATSVAADGRMQLLLAALFGFIGFGFGLFAMYNYRTRDRRRIHAREAATYMDLNYECYRTFDDQAWAQFMTLKQKHPADLRSNTPSAPAATASE